MMAAVPQLFILLLMIASGQSFSLYQNKHVSVTKGLSSTLHAKKLDPTRRNHGHHQKQRSNTNTPKRVPQNKRTAIRWVIQGLERCLAVKEDGSDSGNDRRGKSYRRRIDASLVDALFLMVDANCQKDVLDAEKRVKVLMKYPSEFPMEVNERVIKATAMAGLVSLSVHLLRAVLRERNEDIPSPMAYTAVLNVLRRSGKIEKLEDTLADLASSCRRITARTGKNDVGVGIVAFNTYLAALCDASINEVPFKSSVDEIGNNDDMAFNFTSLTNSSTATTSSSEKYLYKALNLLKNGVAKKKFALEEDPDLYSYNSVLNAAAKCSKADTSDHFSKSVMIACLRLMKERGIQPDTLTYNARIQAALANGMDDAALQLIDQMITDRKIEPDRYTINFMLQPFIKAGRRDEVWLTLREFYDKNVGINDKIISSSFEAFLTTIVKTGEVDLARDIFQEFFLPTPKQRSRIQLTQTIHVMKAERDRLKQGGVSDTTRQKSVRRDLEKLGSHPSPRTRHFNILLGGYSKAYKSSIARIGKSTVLAASKDDALDELKNVTSATVPDIKKAYDLLDRMIDARVPLDTFSVTSLMALPSTPENITSLLHRIEPEMMVILNPAAYRSIISAYGKAGDPSSACYYFEEMILKCPNQSRNVESWNAMLRALSRGCIGPDGCTLLHAKKSIAARAMRNPEDEELESDVISFVDGNTCLDASMTILSMMRHGTQQPNGRAMPKPNSQTYCIVASALSGSGTADDAKGAIDLFRTAMNEGIPADGRLLNAVLRCFGEDIEGALAAWKSDIGPAAAKYEQKSSAKKGTNLIAAYNGLMHVCGRAIKPDIGLRIAYAMNKANVEPTEVTLNSYYAGKRIATNENGSGKNARLQDQYESLLSVECTKYTAKDKRREKDRKIRIIF